MQSACYFYIRSILFTKANVIPLSRGMILRLKPPLLRRTLFMISKKYVFVVVALALMVTQANAQCGGSCSPAYGPSQYRGYPSQQIGSPYFRSPQTFRASYPAASVPVSHCGLNNSNYYPVSSQRVAPYYVSFPPNYAGSYPCSNNLSYNSRQKTRTYVRGQPFRNILRALTP